MLVWDWERFEADVPVGYDALHRAVQTAIGNQGVDPTGAARALIAGADRTLAPFDQDGRSADLVVVLYLVELAARYLRDRQAEAGAGWGTWTPGCCRPSRSTWPVGPGESEEWGRDAGQGAGAPCGEVGEPDGGPVDRRVADDTRVLDHGGAALRHDFAVQDPLPAPRGAAAPLPQGCALLRHGLPAGDEL